MNTYDSYISTLISHFLDYVNSSHGVIGKVETEHAHQYLQMGMLQWQLE